MPDININMTATPGGQGTMSSRGSSTSNTSTSKETIQLILDMSQILNLQLTPEALGHCVSLLEDGADPRQLAKVVKSWRNRGANASASSTGSISSSHSHHKLNGTKTSNISLGSRRQGQ